MQSIKPGAVHFAPCLAERREWLPEPRGWIRITHSNFNRNSTRRWKTVAITNRRGVLRASGCQLRVSLPSKLERAGKPALLNLQKYQLAMSRATIALWNVFSLTRIRLEIGNKPIPRKSEFG